MRPLLDGVFDSYQVWPAAELAPRFAPDAGLQALAVLDQVLRAGFVLASPLLAALLLAELALALVGRVAPQLHVFDLAMAVKGLVYAAGLPAYACAISVHFVVGYENLWHLTPAFLGLTVFLAAQALSYPFLARPDPALLDAWRRRHVSG